LQGSDLVCGFAKRSMRCPLCLDELLAFSEHMPIRIDLGRMPLVVVTWEGSCTDEEVELYLAAMAEVVTRPDRRAVVLDASRAALPSATQRRMQGMWLKEHEDRIKHKTVGTAFVVESAIIRGGLTAVFWIQGLSTQQLVCATLPEALAWAGQRLIDAGVTSRGARSRF